MTKKIPADEAVVFGRIKIIKDGKIIDWKPGPKVVSIVIYRFLPDSFTVFIKDEETKKEHFYRLAGDGSFFWSLPAGTYSVTGYHYYIGSTDVKSHFLPGLIPRFVISKGDSADYIGTLSLELHPIGGDIIKIEDDYARAEGELEREFPEVFPGAKKGLMTFR